MTFDPKKYREVGGNVQRGEVRDDRPFPAGTYLFAATWMERKRSEAKGTFYLKLKLTCVYGPLKGRSFFPMASLDFTKPMAAARFAAWCAAVGDESPINEKDVDALRARFYAHVFMAKVNAKNDTYNGQTRVKNDIEEFIPFENLTVEQNNFAVGWREEWLSGEEERKAKAKAALEASYTDDGLDPDAPPYNDDDY